MYFYNKYKLWHNRLVRLGNIWASEGVSAVCSETVYKFSKQIKRNNGKLMKVFFDVTSRCNSRCITCKMYEKPIVNELSLSEIENIFKSECMKNLGHIALAGGEPFLRDDLADIANMAHSLTGCEVGVVTNGLLPIKIYETVKNMHPKPAVCISLNGRKEIHDFIRGVKGNYEKVMQTRELLWSLGLNPGFSFCITPHNVKEIPWMYELADRLGTSVNFSIVRPLPNLRADEIVGLCGFSAEQKDLILQQLRPGISKDMLGFCLKDSLWFTCYAARQILYICPNADVFPCTDNSTGWMKMGNLRQKSLDEIMLAPRTKKIAERISNFECQPCNMAICFATTSLWCGGRLLSKKDVHAQLQLQQ